MGERPAHRAGRRRGDRDPVASSPLVNEGGAIHVDGEGTVLLTETVQLGKERNPGWTRERVEADVHARLGTEKAIWLPRGLTGDYGTYGTLGHVDIVAAFVRPGTVLAHVQPDPAHPDHEVSRELLAVLRAATDARGRALEVVEVPAHRAARRGRRVGRLLLHQPLPLQRRRGPLRLRRPRATRRPPRSSAACSRTVR
ncbi:Agmatine deiminase [Streptomyces californicus]